MKTNRSLIGYILLNILTLGIYSLFFWHGYVRDINKLCAGDGKNTRGILAMFIFTIFTFGIYAIVWQYGMQNRLRDNAAKYNAGLIKGGGSVLCWSIFGCLLFGIGPFVALHIQIDSMNRLCYGYATMQNRNIATQN